MSNIVCPEKNDLVEERLRRILTEYRESPNLLHMIRVYLSKIDDVIRRVCDLPKFFDIDKAIGHQLTVLGLRLGFPRCHCVCDVQPVFGFECDGFIDNYPIAGFCDDSITWVDCNEFGLGEICINDDEVYRKFLKVRCFQLMAYLDIESLDKCVKILWGNQATVLDQGYGRIVIAPGRDLTDVEIALLQLYPRVLPIALGIEARFHFGDVHVFGFGDGWGGFCEEWKNSVSIETENGNLLVDENGLEITTGVLTQDATWMCEFNVNPYGCI